KKDSIPISTSCTANMHTRSLRISMRPDQLLPSHSNFPTYPTTMAEVILTAPMMLNGFQTGRGPRRERLHATNQGMCSGAAVQRIMKAKAYSTEKFAPIRDQHASATRTRLPPLKKVRVPCV